MRNTSLAILLFAFAVSGRPAFAQDIFASPRPTFSPAPNYPEAARAAGVQGVVAVQVRVDASGSVTEAKALSGPAQLQESALQTAKTWKFEPTVIAGKPTPVVSTINLTFGTPPPVPPTAPVPAIPSSLAPVAVGVNSGVLGGILVPPPRATNPTPAPVTPRPLGIVATTDGDRIIGSLKWEIREEASGKILATGDGPVHLKDVFIQEAPNPSRRQTPKTIRLTDQFVLEMAEFPVPNLADKSGFGITARRTDLQVFSWEWFNIQDSKRAVKLQESGELGIDLKQVNGDWEVTRTEFVSDVSLRMIRQGVDPVGSPPYWRINISKGSNVTWPSIVNGKVVPN